MPATNEYDPEAMMQESIVRIHENWKELRAQSSTGQKGWLTQIKNHYTRLVQTDPEAAVEMLAIHEYMLEKLRKQGVFQRDKKTDMRLSDFIDYV